MKYLARLANLLSVMVIALLSALMVANEPISAAPILPNGYQIETVVSGFNLATTFSYANSNEVFVAEKNGKIVRVLNNQILPTTVYQISNVNDFWDRGLLGMTLDPNFASNGYIYLSYTYENSPAVYDGPKTARIVRITYNPSTGTADPASEIVLAGSVGGTPSKPSCNDYPTGSDCIPSNSPSHSAGGLRFGPDGFLYATLGDGAAFTEVDANAYDAQDLDRLTGKVLRINTDGTAVNSNPFYDGNPNSNRSKIYAYGVRNSYRFNFHPTSGNLYTGEVGWYLKEEINHVTSGANLGWPCREGFQSHPEYSCTAQNYTDPLYAYGHEGDRSNSVTGGAFAANSNYGSFNGSYFFGDYSEDFIKRAVINGDTMSVYEFATDVGGPVDIQTGPDGSIYYLSIYTGELRRIVASNANQTPSAEITVLQQPNTTVPALARFSAENSSDPDTGDVLNYEWDFGDGNTGDGELVSHTYTSEGSFNVALTVFDNQGASDTVTIPVTVGQANSVADPELISTVHSPIPTYLGRTVTTTTTVKNNGGEEPIIIYWEVRNQSGERVYYDYENNILIPANQELSFDFNWLPPVPGTYSIDIGLFSNDWRETYVWNFGAHSITVVDRVSENTNLAWQSTSGNTSAVVGELLTTDIAIKNNGLAGSGVVYVEFYNPQGIRESYQFINESYGDNTTETTSFSWVAQQEGVYTIALGLYTSDWSTNYEPFRENIYNVTIGSGTNTDPFSIELDSVNVTDTQIGNATDVVLSISNTGQAGSGIIYLEFYTENGVRESYQFSQENFITNEAKIITFSFTPANIGEYSVALGLYDPSWTNYYQVFDPRIATINVTQ